MKTGSKLILVSGPARSGKSVWAENILINKPDVTYIATGQIENDDVEWNKRIMVHKSRRPSHWQNVESDGNLLSPLSQLPINSNLLIDSIGGFVTDFIEHSDEQWTDYQHTFISHLSRYHSTIVIVIEEVGWGVVPTTNLGCRFRDRLGYLSQLLEKKSTESWLVIKGRALNLTTYGVPINAR